MTCKPMKQWTVEEVAIWLMCIGYADKVERFQMVTGLDLSNLTSEELSGLDMDQEEADKLLHHVEFTKSVSSLEEMAAELEATKLAKQALEEQLVAKEKKISEDRYENRILAMVHRHEIERRRLEERQEQEVHAEEIDIHRKRQVAQTSPGKDAIHLGKKHFKQEPVDLHRFN